MLFSRREFLGGLAAASALSALPRSGFAMNFESPVPASCPFRLSVINDEISQDFDHACSVAASDFGLHWIELRGMWNKNITDLDANEIDEARRILKKYDLRVTDIASPLYKVDWPGAPRKDGQQRDQFHADCGRQPAGCAAAALHRADPRFFDGSRPLLRLLAARRSGAVSRGHQRQS